ncbi:MAG: gluconokinase [Bacillota bacterium]|nr:gluconokinase [Bacillota bacterium]
MSQRECAIGIDIGTGSSRAAAFDLGGRLLFSQAEEYPLSYPRLGWAEQDPEVVLAAVIKALKDLTARLAEHGYRPLVVGLSSVFHSVLPLGKDGRPLANCLPWADSRSTQIVNAWKKDPAARAWYARTGCPLHPMYLPGKIAWWHANEPELFARTARFVSLKEYIITRLFGLPWVDYSVVSGSGLLNEEKLTYDDDVLTALGIGPERLSKLVPTKTVLGELSPEWAAATGLPPGVPWVIGAGDGALSSLGTGGVTPGILTAMIGTSGAVRLASPVPRVDPKGRTWCYHLTEDCWLLGGAINNGGIVYRWLRDGFVPDALRSYDALNTAAARVPPGSAGIIFLPFHSGERSPYWNADARGIIFGLGLEHTAAHLARATMEGITYRMYSIFQALEELAGPAREVRASGGFARSGLWLKIMADVFGRRVYVPTVPEGSALGAALLALIAVGALPDLKAAAQLVSINAAYEPDPENHTLYQELYALYTSIYFKLQDEFAALARFRERENKESACH